jgi:glucose dehydrogenase
MSTKAHSHNPQHISNIHNHHNQSIWAVNGEGESAQRHSKLGQIKCAYHVYLLDIAA